MYREVAEEPFKEFHFETGRALAERLGYPGEELDAIPAEAIDSFAGVGYYFELARITPGETVVDLGSGSGTDSFLVARQTGESGRVLGIDMTSAQLAKARRLASEHGIANVEFIEAHIEQLPLPHASADLVISNAAPLQIVTPRSELPAVEAALRADPGIASIGPAQPSGALALVSAIPRAAPSTVELSKTIDRVRSELPGGAVVGGAAAENHDLEGALRSRTPLVYGVVLIVGFLLLLGLLRAPLISAAAVATNLLATAAALGVGKLTPPAA
jgi:SAM-dependent methyltransferase